MKYDSDRLKPKWAVISLHNEKINGRRSGSTGSRYSNQIIKNLCRTYSHPVFLQLMSKNSTSNFNLSYASWVTMDKKNDWLFQQKANYGHSLAWCRSRARSTQCHPLAWSGAGATFWSHKVGSSATQNNVDLEIGREESFFKWWKGILGRKEPGK